MDARNNEEDLKWKTEARGVPTYLGTLSPEENPGLQQ
jgi:hypothetical protein